MSDRLKLSEKSLSYFAICFDNLGTSSGIYKQQNGFMFIAGLCIILNPLPVMQEFLHRLTMFRHIEILV
jgi:hypothetical protein